MAKTVNNDPALEMQKINNSVFENNLLDSDGYPLQNSNFIYFGKIASIFKDGVNGVNIW